jgi:uncharacterized glyoxalase superfamily protein PhnB
MNLMPFLLFDGNCAQAMTFYQGCLGGELTITKVCDSPMKAKCHPSITKWLSPCCNRNMWSCALQ